MRVLLDENTPPELESVLTRLDAKHVESLGLKGILNGELLQIARNDFDAFITFDKGIPHQHNHTGQKLIIVILRLGDVKKSTALRHSAAMEEFDLGLVPGDIKFFEPG